MAARHNTRKAATVQCCPYCRADMPRKFETDDGRWIYDPFLTGWPNGIWAVHCPACGVIFYISSQHLPFTPEEIDAEFGR